MFCPVDKSIMVSAPQRQAQTAFSTSSAMLEVTAELPILALILTKKLRPIIIGSDSGWLMLFGIIARPAAISSLTNSGVIKPEGMFAPKFCPGCCLNSTPCCINSSRRWFSRMAIYSISGVIIPFFA